MKELVFLLEEPSAAAMLESFLPRVLPDGIGFRLIPFEGKRDLHSHLTRRVRGYLNRQARFVVLFDQDRHPDCKKLKGTWLQLCEKSGRAGHVRIRIACRELESFYLADLEAVERGLGLQGLSLFQTKAKFRAPDRLSQPSAELLELTARRYQKVSGSREIGKHLRPDNDRSPSFRSLVRVVHELAQELVELP